MFKSTSGIKKNYYYYEKININPRIKKLSLQQADIIKTHGDNKKLIKFTGKIKFSSLGVHIKYCKLVQKI